MQAKELADELSLYSGSDRLKRKVRLLSVSISAKLKELRLISLRQKQKAEKARGEDDENISIIFL